MNMVLIGGAGALGMLAASAMAGGQDGREAAVIRALLVTGQNNHNWRYTSRVHKETLEATGRFEVTIADDAPAALGEPLAGYGLIVLDYNGPRWGEPAERNFLGAVRAGTGVVIIHAANNAFAGWEEYEKLCALLWRDGTGHGRFHRFDVEYIDREHPVTLGLADMKGHPDELYHALVNPHGVPFHTLAEAYSSTDSGGSGRDEPMALVLTYGQGRVFHTPLGHVWEGQHEQKRSISDPQFRALLARGAEWAATGEVALPDAWSDVREHNRLSDAERADGWELLFDGRSADRFRGYRGDSFPQAGWAVRRGELVHAAGGGGGDIITREKFADFEFACEWMAAPGANSGIMYRVSEDGAATWHSGPEMQVLDDGPHTGGKNTPHSAGALYDLLAIRHDVARPAGEWNHARIVVRDGRAEHWLNGWKVVEFPLGGPEWDAMIAGSKFRSLERFGRNAAGHIALQDHGDEVRFRNLMVRRLDGGR